MIQNPTILRKVKERFRETGQPLEEFQANYKILVTIERANLEDVGPRGVGLVSQFGSFGIWCAYTHEWTMIIGSGMICKRASGSPMHGYLFE